MVLSNRLENLPKGVSVYDIGLIFNKQFWNWVTSAHSNLNQWAAAPGLGRALIGRAQFTKFVMVPGIISTRCLRSRNSKNLPPRKTLEKSKRARDQKNSRDETFRAKIISFEKFLSGGWRPNCPGTTFSTTFHNLAKLQRLQSLSHLEVLLSSLFKSQVSLKYST